MNCDRYEEQLSALMDNELADDEAKDLLLHMGGCALCRATLRSQLELRSSLREDLPPQASKELDERILIAVQSRRPGKPDRVAIPGTFWQRRLSMRTPAVALAAVVLVIGSFFLSSLWFGWRQISRVDATQTIYLTAVPTVEVKAYTMKPMTTVQ
jgi:anti-sigma factor RsiW